MTCNFSKSYEVLTSSPKPSLPPCMTFQLASITVTPLLSRVYSTRTKLTSVGSPSMSFNSVSNDGWTSKLSFYFVYYELFCMLSGMMTKTAHHEDMLAASCKCGQMGLLGIGGPHAHGICRGCSLF